MKGGVRETRGETPKALGGKGEANHSGDGESPRQNEENEKSFQRRGKKKKKKKGGVGPREE